MSRHLALPLLTLILALPAGAQMTASPTPARDLLTAGAANPECAMSGVTGEACPTTDVSAVSASTGAARPDVTTAPLAHHAAADVPPPEGNKAGAFFKGAVKGISDYFDDDGVKQGTAFGAAIGMLLLASTPVGIIGGALIGAAVGAILCGGLIQKLWHHFVS